MQIAFYELGNIQDPLGVIHDERENPILEQGENIIARQLSSYCQINKTQSDSTWDFLKGVPIFLNAGEGILFRTNKKLIYLRKPQPKTYLNVFGSYELGMKFAEKAKKWVILKRMESFFLPIKEVYSCKVSQVMVEVLIWADKRYVLNFRPYNPNIFQGLRMF